MIYVSNISLIITNIKLMYKNTLRNTSWGATVRESATPPSTPNKIFWMKPFISISLTKLVLHQVKKIILAYKIMIIIQTK